MDNNQFATIREVARRGLLPESCLRRLLREGNLPGFFCGNRFYINTPALLKQLGVEADAAEVRS